MKFQLSVEAANKLYAHAKAERIANQTTRPRFSLIQCHIEENVLTAQFIANISTSEYKCPINDGETGDCWLAPPAKKFSAKADKFVMVEDEKDKTTYTTAQGSQTLPKPEYIPERCNTDRFWDREVRGKVYLDPNLLYDALSAYARQDRDAIKIEFGSETAGIYISNRHGEKTLVLPINPNRVDF